MTQSEGWKARNLGGTWKVRRKLIYASLAFDMLVILYSLMGDVDPAIANNAITMAFTHGGGVMGVYVFGAVWDDRNQRWPGHGPGHGGPGPC